MSKKITLIIDTILTPYEVARYNAINEVLGGSLVVWFQAESDINRHWKKYPKIAFEYEVLNDKPIRLIGKDIHTFHVNPDIAKKLLKSKENINQIIICGWDSLTYWQTVTFSKKHDIPYVLWSGSTKYERSWRRNFFMPIIRWVVSGAYSYIAYGSRAKEYLISLGAPQSKVRIFMNSVDVDYFQSEANLLREQRDSIRTGLKFKTSDFVYLYIGQLIERKGIIDLLEAFSQLPANSKLILIGSGMLKERVLEFQKKNLTAQITVIPHMEYQELPKYYVAADCLVLPSHEEVWGLVVNEALACGTPVITSDAVGASPDLVFDGKTGYTYKSGSVSLLLNCMRKIQNKHFDSVSLQAFAQTTHPQIFAKKVFPDI